MARGSLLGLMFLLLWSVTAGGVSVETVTEGEDVVLQCSTSERIDDIRDVTVEWRRNDSTVLLFRDGRYDHTEQDPYFQDRAALDSPELKNGDLSLNLMKTQSNDTGLYQCYFFKASFRKRRASEEPLNTITLEVKESGSGPGGDLTETGERPRLRLVLAVDLVVFAVFAVIAAVLFVRVFPKLRTPQIDKKPTEIPAEFVSLSVGQNKSSVCAPLVSDVRSPKICSSPEEQSDFICDGLF